MFAVICVEKEKRRLRKQRCRVEAVQTAVRGGAPFRIITVTQGAKGLDWHRIATAASCGSRNLLLPKGLSLPDNHYLNLFKADTLPLLIMLNTAAQKLERDDAAKRSLLIEDTNGVLPDYIDRVAPCASKIKIITDNPQAYFGAGIRLMERFGASPIICNSINKNEKFDAAVSKEPSENATLNFSVSSITADGTPEIPEPYLRLCPEEIDRFEFLCALFECSGVRAIGEITLNDLLSGANQAII